MDVLLACKISDRSRRNCFLSTDEATETAVAERWRDGLQKMHQLRAERAITAHVLGRDARVVHTGQRVRE
jgi:hypothetical protein